MNRMQRYSVGCLKPVLAAVVLLGTTVGCQDNAPRDLIESESSTAALVFVKTTGEETLNRDNSSGNLYKLQPIAADGRVTALTNYTGASISDPCVSYDGQRILFSMRPPGASDRNIWEIGADGDDLRQVTAGGGNDFDPLYLPNGKIMFTSSRADEMDEYNRSPAEHLHTCNADGSNIERISFNQSDDFDPTVMPDGSVLYTRWEHFGTFNRFPLFFTQPDGGQTFHKYGPHNRNFFHPQPTPDGRIIAIESRRVNEDSGPIAVLKLEMGPADPPRANTEDSWNVLTPDVNNDGPPWGHGTFKYPFPIGQNRYVVSYTLPAADEEEVDYGLYTFSLSQEGAGTDEDPATISIRDLTFLFNDPDANEYDAQLLAPHAKPPVLPDTVTPGLDYGVFMASDVFNRSSNDGQEVPVLGVDRIDSLAVIVGLPIARGEPNDYSANTFERRAILGMAPVYEDGSFSIKVPADLPISFSTLDSLGRAFVSKRTWIYVRPGEVIDQCTGCHKDRGLSEELITNPDPISHHMEPTDLNRPASEYEHINYRDHIGPIIEAKCASCHFETFAPRDSLVLPDSTWVTVIDTIPAPGFLDLTAVLDTLNITQQVFPRAYINLSGETRTGRPRVVVPVFPRRSLLIDTVLGVDSRADLPPHPTGEQALSADEKRLLNFWVMLGAQYR